MLQEILLDYPSASFLTPDSPSRLDPLQADTQMSRLPHLNRDRDLSTLVAISRQLSSNLDIPAFNRDEARASLRDLGMLSASLKRHGVEPAIILPELERALIACGDNAGTVPRDTVYSYGPWNPEGSRRRRFTVFPQEEIFIRSFKEGMSELDTTVDEVDNAASLDLNDPLFAQSMRNATQHFGLTIDAIVQVRRQVPPEIFTGELRPFFEPFRVSGENYLAPGGAQMPLLLIDQLIWGSDCDDERYQRYFAENIKYSPVEIREKSAEFKGQESLITRLKKQFYSDGTIKPQEMVSLTSMLELLNKLMAFRRPHLAVAKENFKLREQTDVGSGGYKPDILDFLIDKTEESRDTVKGVLNG